ncbi:RtcB family protein [Chitinophagaceae bacterium MMS25-I14]
MSNNIRPKELSKMGYHSDIARSIAINTIGMYCKHQTKESIIATLKNILEQPDQWRNDTIWYKLANALAPEETETVFTSHELRQEQDAANCKVYGGKYIETAARQQMLTARCLPVAVQAALMPDAHAGYGLPVGCVLAADNAAIPYAVGVDIGCRMAMTILDANDQYLKRNVYAISQAIRDHTHFGMEGSLGYRQEHAVLDDNAFKTTELLRSMHGKAVRQLGTSGGGNHFVEFGTLELKEENTLDLPAGNYAAILSHSGSRGLGAAIAQHYTRIAMDVCRLPREAKNLAWLDMNSQEGQEYWLSMQLAGAYAKACHDRIHYNLCKALGVQPLMLVENHHNFAWKEQLPDGREVIVHRKGATPAHKGELGIIPGNMIGGGYLVSGTGNDASLQSASHGAGRAMSRRRAKDSITVSSMKKQLAAAGVTLIGGSPEEAPAAYKDLEQVMQAQQELVNIEGKFTPRIVRMNKE